MDDLTIIQKKIKDLRAELARLESAERVILEVRGNRPAQQPSFFEDATQRPATPKSGFDSLTSALRGALMAIGPATTREIVSWLREYYQPDVNAHSVRSMLSIGGKKKEFIRDEASERWALPARKAG
ncbi:MAG: hypothetical protein L6R28_00780 [Planctomycetes bacterium]|nr:hypothetical protein [Planctomycetota bacterium]